MDAKINIYREIIERYNMGMLTAMETIYQLGDATLTHETQEFADQLERETVKDMDIALAPVLQTMIDKLLQ